MKTPRLLSGLDVLLEDPSLLHGLRLGLVANPASVTSRFVPTARALLDAGLDLRLLFGPEHGLTGAVQDMLAVGDDDTPGGRLPVVSLYGERFEDLAPKAGHLAGLDAVVCDLPDVGSRYYTFVWTTFLVTRACAAAGMPVFVLDRPNPLGGLAVEGNLPEERLLSFVGLRPVPARHGMTPGELARWANAESALGCDLTVVPMKVAGKAGAAPRGRVGETPDWVLPSPNMPTPDTALVYPGMCLLEGTNLSEARGTTRPFETVGAPWLDAELAADRANALGLPGVLFRPHVFRPTFHKFAGLDCGGVQLHVTDAEAFRPYETGLRLVKLLRDLDPARFRWRTETYEFRNDVPAVDLLAGTPRYRELVDAGESLDAWIDSFADDVARFAPSRQASLLYRPGPPRVQVVGAHDSGKTTHALALVAALVARGLSVGAVKHTRDEYETDVEGSDSQRHFAAGASPVVFVSGRRTGVHARHEAGAALDAVIAREMPHVDVVVVEGFRETPGLKVEVCRAATGREPVAPADADVFAVMTDRETAHPASVPRLPLGAVDALVPFVLRALDLGGAE
jgi:molybdopterin-guanine dinucleotide biosynthesis protein MobB